MDSKTRPEISVISPVFNEAENLQELYERIRKAIPSKYSWELILIDDGSSDGSWEKIKFIAKQDPRVKGIFFSRNYGHQVALTAGYEHAAGRVVISLDSDLQHPPEVILEMIALWQQGNQIVFARRRGSNLGWLKGMSSRFFYSFFRKITRLNIIENAADFRLLDEKVVKYLKQYRESSRFIRAIVADLGFKYAVLDYKEDFRRAGSSKYSFYKMMRLGLKGITSFSNAPLRLSILVGMVISGVSLIYSAWLIYYKLRYDIAPGMASVLVGVFFIGGIQLVSIGILGEYVANIFTEVKQRPLYCVSESVGYDEKDISHGN